MIQNFNIFDEYEIPEVSICYPNRVKIGDLSRLTDFTVDLKFNALSEISFDIPERVDEIDTPFYSQIKQKNKIHIENIGWFIIGDVSEKNNGVYKYKSVPATSEESFFNYKSVNLLDGTYKFYDAIDNSDTMMGKIMGYIPSWSIGTISASLFSKYRTFDVTTSTLYSFIMSKVCDAYECFFEFDTENKIINVYDSGDVVTATNIVLSFDNLIKEIEIKEKSDEYVTALAVTGGGDLDIRTVNPVGGLFIYDYSYPISQEMMSEELAAAITSWNEKIDAQQEIYATKLAEYKTLNSEYITLLSEMSDLQSEKTSIETLMQVRIDAGIEDLSDLAEQLAIINSEISDKQEEIDTNRAETSALYDELTAIVEDLAIDNNFEGDLYYELQEYTIESSYQNENIIQTSSMTAVQVQEQAQYLYDQGKAVLAKLSQPRYEFTVDSANFIFLKQYTNFTQQVRLGATMRVELDDGRYFTPVLLEYTFNFYDPTDFSLKFGNRMKLDDSLYSFADLIEDSISAGSSVNVNSSLWNSWSNNYESDVSNFISGSLDASKNAVINSTNQEITIDSVGLRGKKILEDGTYDPKQIWMTSKTIALTRDNWNSVSTAVGEITLPDGSTNYGLAGGLILGNIVASEELIIENESNKFRVDANGATLTDADFTVTASNNSSRTIISPSEGFRLQTNVGGTWVDSIYLDTAGNATFAGKIVATSGTIGGFGISSSSITSSAADDDGNIITLNNDGTCRIGSFEITKDGLVYTASFSGNIISNSGTIGGWNISSDGLESSYGDYIRSNGTGKLGLLTYSGSTARFSGYVQANNISTGGSYGYVTGSQVGSHTITGTNMEPEYNTIKADVATLNQIVTGVVTASTIKVNQLQINNGLKFETRYGEWRLFSDISSSVYVLCGNLLPS